MVLDQETLRARVIQIVAIHCGIPQESIGDHDSWRNVLGLDSEGQLEVVFKLERAFSIYVDDDHLGLFDSVAQAVDWIPLCPPKTTD
jgi:acyl carrier protein